MFGLEKAVRLPPNVITVGPLINSKAIKPLEFDIRETLDKLDEKRIPVIYISFGTLINSDFLQINEKIVKAIETLLKTAVKVNILWSTTASKNFSSLSGVLSQFKDRIIIKSWVNQKAVLMHPAVKVFLTHGGFSLVNNDRNRKYT